MSSHVLPVSTRLWAAVLTLSGAFLLWALMWPAAKPKAQPAPPLPAIAAPKAVTALPAPNAADPAWARPSFFNNRSPRVAMVGDEGSGDANGTGGFSATLNGIVRSPRLLLASLSSGGKPVRVRLGDEVEGQPGWRLVALAPRSATFRNGEQQQVLKLEARSIHAASQPPAIPPAAPPAPPSVAPPVAGDAQSSASSPSEGATPEPSVDERKQIEAIRQRIQARRQQALSPPPSAPKSTEKPR